MTLPLLPDPELLVIDALRHYLPGDVQNVFTTPPTDWADQMPFLAVAWKGGSPNAHPERLQVNDMTVKAYVPTRRQGSDLFRKIERALKQACLEHFTNRGLPGVDVPGVLCYVREVSPAGLEYEGLTSKHPDSVLFSGIFRITSAPTLP